MDETRWTATSSGLARYIWLLWVVWLAFLWFPISALFGAHPGPLRAAVVLLAAAVFCAIYTWNIIRSLRRLQMGEPERDPWPVLIALAAIALALTVGDRRDWVELFIFVTVSLGPSLPARRALAGVGLLVLFAPVLGVALGDPITQIVQMMFQSAVSGVAVVIVVRTVVLDRELRLAREEIARLAVSEERLRFARDLHDLLGHSLSLIALKSELAGRLASAAPERAAAEMRDVEQAARTALHEVREAVAGYRQPTLASELQSAREILSAAGIDYQREGELPTLPAALEAALSWTVREGVTNVIKHSRAHRCTVRLTHDETNVGVDVTDDGGGVPQGAVQPSALATGSGLSGLAERVAALSGRCEGGPGPAGGFRLAVSIPLPGKLRDTRDSRGLGQQAAADGDNADAGPRPEDTLAEPAHRDVDAPRPV